MAFNDEDRRKLNYLVAKVQRLEQLMLAIQRMEGYEMAWLDDLKSEVANNTTVAQGAVVAINALADKLQEVVNAGADPADIQAVIDQLRNNDATLAAAVASNTNASSEPPPVPVAPAVQPEPA